MGKLKYDQLADLLENAPTGLLMTTPEGQIVFANGLIEHWTGRSRSDLLGGLRIQDLLPPAKQIHYETHIAPAIGLRGEVNEISTALKKLSGGSMPIFLHASVSVDDGGKPLHYRFSLSDARQRGMYEAELRYKRRQAEQFSAVLQTSPDAILTLSMEHNVDSWNTAAVDMFGRQEHDALDMPIEGLLAKSARHAQFYDLLSRTGDDKKCQIEVELTHSSGKLVPAEIHASALRDHDGKQTGHILIIREISERVEATRRLDYVVQELQHRSKNLLSVVQVVARQTARSAVGEDFLEDFDSRLRSLATNQDLLVENTWRGVLLSDLVAGQLHPFIQEADSQVKWEGEPYFIEAKAAEMIGMAFYELATNASKYGAMSTNEGRVSISWGRLDDDPERLFISWIEEGGPPVEPPTRKGFGHTVTTSLVQSAVRGHVSLEYDSAGLTWRLTAPESALLFDAE